MIGRSTRSTRRNQRGQGLLLLMLVMLVAGAAVLLEGIGSRASIRASDDEGTTRALALAKEALIAYAVLDATRPGELPCPDFNRNGIINPIGNEDYAHPDCHTRRGWLPWRTLDMEDVRDGAGERLWYAVAQDYFARSGTGPRPEINPDTAGGLTVDSATDIVAVIIAPGEARGGQSRPADPPGGAPDASAHVAAYLEGVNADPDLDTYAGSGGADFNDRVVYITAQELMSAVEQRVLGEVAVALREYRETNGAFPWLSPFQDPDAVSAFDGVPGTRVGHLASTNSTDDIGAPQDTGYTIMWDADGEPITSVSDNFSFLSFSLDAASSLLLQDSATADASAGSHTFPTPIDDIPGNSFCTWHGSIAVADCEDTFQLAPYFVQLSLFGVSLPLPAQVTREISFDVAYTGEAAVGSLDGARVRDVASGATFQAFPDTEIASTITVRHYLTLLPAISTTRRLTISHGSTASVNVTGVYLEADAATPVDGDMPRWFYENQWDRFVLVKYANDVLPRVGVAVPPPSPACTPGDDCVNLDIVNAAGTSTRDDAGAIVIGAGRQLATQDRDVSPGDQFQYFEGALNRDLTPDPVPATAERRVLGIDFNDQVRVVEPQPSLPPPPPPPPPPPVQPS